jgi:prepilin-type N-terminal cleavage/methylation domain-containing protein/prepilin-type processing-associated H-X9-DG protein
MNRQKGFTLIELLVVIAIVALLMAILMPALQRVRKQAKVVVCQSRLHQWSIVFSMYTDDNKGYFPAHYQNSWIKTGLEYSKDEELFLCPMATKSFEEGTRHPFASWERGGVYISYGFNEWAYNHQGGDGSRGRLARHYWNTPNLRGAHDVPVLADMSDHAEHPEGQPFQYDEPPVYDGAPRGSAGEDEMRVYCINRHDGVVNVLFADWTVRKVGLKELWTLKWHRDFDAAGPWTTAGLVQPSDWPVWMKNLIDY